IDDIRDYFIIPFDIHYACIEIVFNRILVLGGEKIWFFFLLKQAKSPIKMDRVSTQTFSIFVRAKRIKYEYAMYHIVHKTMFIIFFPFL
ncbi:hypothetical protein ACJX0J_040552, partial [Zea mays]